MIVYKIYHYSAFEEVHIDYFNSLLEVIKQQNLLSPSIDEIIITDNIEGEIQQYSESRFRQLNLTRNREYTAIAKTVEFEGKKKIFFDAINVNIYAKYTSQIFFEQLIEVYAEDVVSHNYKVSQTFSADTALTEIVEMFFSKWATTVVANATETILAFQKENIHNDAKMFVDAFKRNIRKLQYQHQADLRLDVFWIDCILGLDDFIRRCLDVKFDNGTFNNLQEFSEIIPSLLTEIEIQTQHLLKNEEVDISSIRKYVLEILNKCSIDIPSEKPMSVQIMETPKKLFKGNLVDTEPRIVGFIDILGFSAIINEYDSDKTSNILNELHDTLEMAIKVSIDSMTNPQTKTDLKEYLEYRMFSDCICLSLPYIEFGNDFHIQFHSLTAIVKAYQLAMMQKGFFVRGGISIGSFYADKNMIFSGGLVKAYKLEQKASYPIIILDRDILERLEKDFASNASGLFIEDTLLYLDKEPEKIFLNPFDFLDNSTKYLDYMQSTFDNLIKENEEDKNDPLSAMTTAFLKLSKAFVEPSLSLAKSYMKPEDMNEAKRVILERINQQLKKHEYILNTYKPETDDYKEVEKIIRKFSFLKLLTEWSMGMADSTLFKYYQFS